MEEKLKYPCLSSLLTLFLCISATSTNPHNSQTQTLLLHTLPDPPTLSWPESATVEPDPEPTTSLSLHHIDALSFNKTPSQLFHLRLERDAARVKTLTHLAAATNKTRPANPGSGFSSSVVSGLSQGSGEYFTRLGVGTPPKYLYMVLDTGSDVVWLQCKPCTKCYSQTDQIFDPSKSKSFAGIPC